MTEKVDFDNYADVYEKTLEEDLKFFGEENSYFAKYKIDIVKKTLGFKPAHILDYGCGIGRNIKEFKKFFPDTKISGCDISAKSIELAIKENPQSEFFIINDENISANENKFDVVFISCVFHHIEPGLRKDSIEKIAAITKPGGAVYIFEHNPFNPVTQKIVKDCVWDTDAILLKMKESEELMLHAGLSIEQKKYTLYFPAVLKFLRPIESLLCYIPLGGQYFVKATKPN